MTPIPVLTTTIIKIYWILYFLGIPLIGIPLAKLTLYLVRLGDDIYRRSCLVFVRDSLHPLSFWLLWNRRKRNSLSDYEGIVIEALFSEYDDLKVRWRKLIYISLSAIYWPVKIVLFAFGLVIIGIENSLSRLFFGRGGDDDSE